MRRSARFSFSIFAVWFAIALCVAPLAVSAPRALAQGATTGVGTRVTVNGVPLPAAEDAVLKSGVAFVPMRSTFEKLGANVKIEGDSASAQMNGSTVFQATIGSTAAKIKGNAHVLLGAPFKENDRVYIPVSAITAIFGAKVVHDVNGFNISAVVPSPVGTVPPLPTVAASPIPAATQGGVSWWVWLILALILLALLWWFLRRREPPPPPPTAQRVVPPTTTTKSTTWVQTLVSSIPGLSTDHRAALAQSVLGSLEDTGTSGQSLQNAGVDVAGARNGDVGAVTDLVRRGADQNLPALRDGVAAFARNTPAFLQNLPPGLVSQIRQFM